MFVIIVVLMISCLLGCKVHQTHYQRSSYVSNELELEQTAAVLHCDAKIVHRKKTLFMTQPDIQGVSHTGSQWLRASTHRKDKRRR